MKQIALFTLLTFGLLFISCSVSNEINEGMIRYELSMGGSTDKDTLAERKNTFDLFTDMKMNIYFKDGKTLVESSMMEDAMKFKMLNDPEKQDSLIYIDMMGKKFKSKDVNRNLNLDEVEISNVETFENDRKVIAGYDAYRIEITMNVKGKDLESTAYVTEEFYFDGKVNENMIQNQNFLIQTKNLMDIKGTVLEQTITSNSMFGSMIMTATEVSTSVDDSVFEINQDDYKSMPMDAFSKANFPGF